MEKRVVWIGSSLKNLKEFPDEVKDEVGYILYLVQIGKHHRKIKPLKGLSGVMEMVTDFDKDTYRTVYC